MGAVALDRARVLSDQKPLGELLNDPGQPLCAVALHIFRPADDALVGADLEKRIDPPAGVAVQVFDLDDLHRTSLTGNAGARRAPACISRQLPIVTPAEGRGPC